MRMRVRLIMAKQFKGRQKDVIDFNEKRNLLVSASAGTGKTSVLTEKVANLIYYNSIAPKDILVVTFTKAAAKEMQLRIRDRLIELKAKPETIVELEEANFQTFDSFYMFLLQTYGHFIGLEKNISILDANVYYAFLQSYITKALQREMSKIQPNKVHPLQTASEFLNERTWNGVLDFMMKLDASAEQQLNKISFYDNFENDYVKNTKLDLLKSDYAKLCIHNLKNNFELLSLYKKKYPDVGAVIDRVITNLLPYLDAANLQDLIEIGLGKVSSVIYWGNLFPDKETDEMHRRAIKKIYESSKAMLKLAIDSDMDPYIVLNNRNYGKVSYLLSIMKDIEIEFFEFRKEKSLFTFSDITRLVVQLLDNPDFKNAINIRSRYKNIFIDEFQDTSIIQDNIISRFANNNLFIVGDVKQSIYRFRNAEVSIFNNYFNSYIQGIGGHAITLDQNFRSREEVIRGVNAICNKLFLMPFPSINYQQTHTMYPGNQALKDCRDSNSTCGIELLTDSCDLDIFSESQVKTNADVQRLNDPKLIAADIIDRMNRGEMVYDDQQEKMVPIRLKDFAILIKKKSDFEEYLKIFNTANIPLKPKYSLEISDTDTYYTFVNIIRAINAIEESNLYLLRREITSLARSFLFEENDNNLYQFNKSVANISPKIREIIDLLLELKEMTPRLSLTDLTLLIFEKFDYYNKIPKIGDIMVNNQIIQKLIDFASQAAQLGANLEDFLQLVNNFQDENNPLKFNVTSEVEDAVFLTTIHDSKGLQYKVVYLPDLLSSPGNNKSINSRFVYSHKYGAIAILDPKSASNKAVTMLKELEKNEELAERIRVFYVALTRAEERVILVHPYRKELTTSAYSNLKSTGALFSSSIFQSEIKPSAFTIRHYSSLEKKLDSKFIINDSGATISLEEPLNLPKQELLISGFTKMNQIKFSKKDLEKNLKVIEDDSLSFGTNLHRLLELTDLRTRDISHIQNDEERSIIEAVLELKVFKRMETAELILPEFEYYDEAANATYIIDLLVEYGDHIEIIDYKTNDISKDIYIEQVNNYRRYIQTKTKKPIKMYLVSILKKEAIEISEVD